MHLNGATRSFIHLVCATPSQGVRGRGAWHATQPVVRSRLPRLFWDGAGDKSNYFLTTLCFQIWKCKDKISIQQSSCRSRWVHQMRFCCSINQYIIVRTLQRGIFFRKKVIVLGSVLPRVWWPRSSTKGWRLRSQRTRDAWASQRGSQWGQGSSTPAEERRGEASAGLEAERVPPSAALHIDVCKARRSPYARAQEIEKAQHQCRLN